MSRESKDREAPATGGPPQRTRLSVLFAASKPKAVILRRGPRDAFALVSWALDTHRFDCGQWMKGKVKLCDLSPEGDLLLYFAAQYHRTDLDSEDDSIPRGTLGPPPHRPGRKPPRYKTAQARKRLRQNTGTWTAISRPPYFTALAYWPSEGTWTGGGCFLSEREIFLWESADGLRPRENVPIPSETRFYGKDSLPPGSMVPQGWRSAYSPAADKSEVSQKLRLALAEAGVERVDWLSLHQGRDLFFAADGRIYELKAWADVPPSRYLAEASLLADLREMRFELREAPAEALRW